MNSLRLRSRKVEGSFWIVPPPEGEYMSFYSVFLQIPERVNKMDAVVTTLQTDVATLKTQVAALITKATAPPPPPPPPALPADDAAAIAQANSDISTLNSQIATALATP